MNNAWFKEHLADGKSSLPFSFTYGGRPSAPLLAEWPAKRADERLDAYRTRRTLTWTDPKTGLEVRCVAVDYTDYPVVEWTVWFKNTGSADTPILEDLQGLDLRLERDAKDGEFVLHGIKGDSCTADSYEPYHRTLAPGTVATFAPPDSSGKSCDGPNGWPYFNLQQPGGGVILAVGWPGQWAASFARDATTGLRLRAGQQLTRLLLKPGEEIRTPLTALLFWQGSDVVEAQNLWRRWYRAHNLPRIEGKPQSPTTILSVLGDNAERTDLQAVLDAGVQIDIFWRDAGGLRENVWFQVGVDNFPKWINHIWLNSGTWEIDTVKYPHGFRPLSDWAHQRGIQFMLWFEPERVGDPNSWLGKNHPEWLLPDNFGAGILDEGNPAARQWLTDHISGMIVSQGLDWYREDMNGGGPLPAWRKHDAPDRQGLTENLYVQGHLAFWDELRRRHPHLRIDSCASGGRRNDLETMRRAVPLLRSDFQFVDMPGVVEGNQGHTYGLSAWLPFQGTASCGSDPYEARSFYLPSFGFRRFLWWQKPEKLDRMRQAYEECRKIAPMMLDGDYYPLTPYSLAPDQWIAWQFHRPEQGDGVVQAFRRKDCAEATRTYRLRGLEPAATYILSDFDREGVLRATGKELMEKGLAVEIPDRPFEKGPAAEIKGAAHVALPGECVVFGPFAKTDGVPAKEALRRIPDELVLGKHRAAPKRQPFAAWQTAKRTLDLGGLLAANEETAFVYIPFTAAASGPATFGFGADWWYEAYLDGVRISETLYTGGNGKNPLTGSDFKATVDVAPGEHLLVVRFLRGASTARLAVSGPADLEEKHVTAAPGAAIITYRKAP
jgi:alpha-galactosidase